MRRPTIPESVRDAPRGVGLVELIVARPGEGRRQLLDEAEIEEDRGLVGDDWATRGTRDGPADPERQVTLMSIHAAAWLLGPRERWPEAGDQLFVDLDLSEDHLPPGSRLSIGSAEVTVTAAPHLGCAKFRQRFGAEALHRVNDDAGRTLRLRGANARVTRPGRIRVGDAVICSGATDAAAP